MDKPNTTSESTVPDTLARRVFAIAMVGAVLYIGAVILLMTTLQ